MMAALPQRVTLQSQTFQLTQVRLDPDVFKSFCVQCGSFVAAGASATVLRIAERAHVCREPAQEESHR
jgi:RNase P subunit RPR2